MDGWIDGPMFIRGSFHCSLFAFLQKKGGKRERERKETTRLRVIAILAIPLVAFGARTRMGV